VVQYICQQLILELDAREDRVVTSTDLDTIAGSPEFGENIVKVIWGSTTPMERLITLLMLNRPSITAVELQALLREHGLGTGLPEIGRALDGLILCSILNQDGPHCYFAAPAFPSTITITQDVQALLDKTIQDCEARCPQASALAADGRAARARPVAGQEEDEWHPRTS
jgi:hypothetical protein